MSATAPPAPAPNTERILLGNTCPVCGTPYVDEGYADVFGFAPWWVPQCDCEVEA